MIDVGNGGNFEFRILNNFKSVDCNNYLYILSFSGLFLFLLVFNKF